MLEKSSESPKWRLIYVVVGASLVITILLLYFFTQVYA